MTNEHLDSLDATLAAARSAWDGERKALQDQIFALQTELALTKEAHIRADEAKSGAERMTVKLLTQFAIVSTVFAEARALALKVGFDEEQAAKNDEPQHVTAAKAAIDAAINGGAVVPQN